MARSETYDGIKKRHVESMGEDLGLLFDALWNEVAWLYAKWNEYVELFGTKPSRIDLVNRVAPLFFRVVQDTLWEDTLLHIARLTDPPKSMGKHNLTIERLDDMVTDDQAKTNITKLIKVAKEKADFCRDWRNRHIAHRDFHLAMDEGAEPLKSASRAKVKEALEAISAVLNAISVHYTGSTIGFDSMPSPGGAVSMLYVLDDGLQAEKEKQERIGAREYRADDFKPRDL